MKALLFAVAIGCCGDAMAARSLFQVRCEQTIKPARATLSARQNGYTINTKYSYHDITALKGKAPANAFVAGLTHTQSQVQMSHAGTLLEDRLSGYECISPQIEVELSYAPVIIYIGREFKPGTCSYDEILAHEMRHLKAYLDHLPKVETVVRKALAARFDNKPLYAKAGQSRAALKRELETGWMPYIDREMKRVELVQAQIDTPQEYARLSRICKGEVQSLIGPAKRARR